MKILPWHLLPGRQRRASDHCSAPRRSQQTGLPLFFSHKLKTDTADMWHWSDVARRFRRSAQYTRCREGGCGPTSTPAHEKFCGDVRQLQLTALEVYTSTSENDCQRRRRRRKRRIFLILEKKKKTEAHLGIPRHTNDPRHSARTYWSTVTYFFFYEKQNASALLVTLPMNDCVKCAVNDHFVPTGYSCAVLLCVILQQQNCS